MGNIFVKRGLGTWQKRQATPTASNSTQQATIKKSTMARAGSQKLSKQPLPKASSPFLSSTDLSPNATKHVRKKTT
jgi:hypothetical protein